MMEKQPAPSFDDWVEYCFTQGNADFQFRYGSPGYEEVEKRIEKFCDLDPVVLADYTATLFGSPGFVAQRYSDEQIAEATWFLFGVASSYFGELFSDAVPTETQVRCMDLVATFYTDLFDLVCGKRGTDPDTDYTNSLSVDVAVYMIWEVSLIGGVVMFPDRDSHLAEPGFGVLKTVLEKCRTSSCLMSALHGLGHIQMENPQRVEQIIDEFLSNRQIPMWLHEYAMRAREGAVL